MSALEAAAIALARTRTLDGTVFVVGPAVVSTADAGAAASSSGGAFDCRMVSAPQAETALRAATRAGDAIVVIGAPEGAESRDRILRRGPAWGAATIWLGFGADAPEEGLATVRLETAEPQALFERLLAAAEPLIGDTAALAPAIAECTDEVCITCSDEGRLGEVVEPPAGLFLPALVRGPSGVEEVDTTMVGAVAPGDLVLIHAGGAIARIPEQEHEQHEHEHSAAERDEATRELLPIAQAGGSR